MLVIPITIAAHIFHHSTFPLLLYLHMSTPYSLIFLLSQIKSKNKAEMKKIKNRAELLLSKQIMKLLKGRCLPFINKTELSFYDLN